MNGSHIVSFIYLFIFLSVLLYLFIIFIYLFFCLYTCSSGLHFLQIIKLSNVHLPHTYFLHFEHIFVVLLSLQYLTWQVLRTCVSEFIFVDVFGIFLLPAILDIQRQVLQLTAVKISSLKFVLPSLLYTKPMHLFQLGQEY